MNVDDAALAPDTPTSNGMQVDMSAHQRLDMAIRLADPNDPTKIPPPTNWSNEPVGLPNPNGRGIHAFEPDTIIGPRYAQEKTNADAATATAEARAAAVGTPLGDGTGKVGNAIQAAMNLANRKVPYVWGGTTANGVDCSGLLYYAFNSAGIKMPRYRAQDYGHMGQAVDGIGNAKPGDVIYYDEGGGNGHVGLYIGNGQMIAAPQTGDHVRVQAVYGSPTSIRRLFSDDHMQQAATPDGAPGAFNYDGRPFAPWMDPMSGTINRVPGIHQVT